MAKVLKIRELGDPLIRTKAKEVKVAEIKSKKFQNFLQCLIQTCDKENGVGIAAPQVGVSKRVFIVWSRPNKKIKQRYPKAPKMDPLVIINPKIVSRSKKLEKDWEGCLSVPGLRAKVPRHVSVETEFLDTNGRKISKKFSGTTGSFVARIFQHEFDHLNGIVFLDRVDSKDIVTEKEFKKIIFRKK